MAQVNFNDKSESNKILTAGDINTLKHAINENDIGSLADISSLATSSSLTASHINSDISSLATSSSLTASHINSDISSLAAAGGGSVDLSYINSDISSLAAQSSSSTEVISNGSVSGYFDTSNQFRYNHHIIPESNSNFDLGNAEYKVRHLFLSSNSLWIGDENKIDASSGEVKTKKRNKNVLPFYITGASTLNKTESEVLTALDKSAVADITLSELEQYAKTIDSDVTIDNIYPREDNPNYYPADFEYIFEQNDNIGRVAKTTINDGSIISISLLEGSVVNLDNNQSAPITLDIHGLPEEDFSKGQITLYVANSAADIQITVQVNGKPSTLSGDPQPLKDGLHIITIDLLYHSTVWNHFITLK